MNAFLALAALAATVVPAHSIIVERAAASDPSSFSSASYDYVVIGAGPGGLAVASKLAADGSKKVAVLEAGLYLPNDPLIDVPKNFGLNNGNPKYDWRFNTTPQVELGGRTVNHPRGKVVGGSTALNYMVFNRASKEEYDSWSEIGNDGWDWDSLLPSFKSSSNYSAITESEIFPSALNASDATSQEQTFIGTGGEIHASYNTYYTDLAQPYVLAMNAMGVTTNSLQDTGNTTGIYNTPTAVDRDTGKRAYAAAYYASNLGTNNLVVLTGAQATKINFSGTKRNNNLVATSVTFQVNGTSYTVNAGKEVILSAGAFQSPQLLELSGIGNSTILQAAGVSTLVNLPGVGENLQDHAMATQMWQVNDGVETWDQLRINQTFAAQAAHQYNTTHDGPLASTISTLTFTTFQAAFGNETAFNEAMTGLDTWLSSVSPTGVASKQYDIQKQWINETSVPGMEFVMIPMGGLTKTHPANDTSYLIVAAILEHPFSRGSVHINSSNPIAYPLIDPKYLTSPFDLAALTAGVEFANKLVSTEPLASLITTRIDPATNFTTTADFEGYVKASLNTIKHPTGTCAMAPQNIGGVVDSNLKVYGTDNVRVVDASIFPQHLAAHMQATVYAIGEKAADIIASGSSTGNTNAARHGIAAGSAALGVFAMSSLWLVSSLF